MPDRKRRANALLSPMTKADWRSKAGALFRRMFLPFTAFARKHVDADMLAEAGKCAIIGAAEKNLHENQSKQADAIKSFAEAEKTRMEAEIMRRSTAAKVRREEAEANSAEFEASRKKSEASVAQIEALKKTVELQEWLASKGLAVVEDDDGQFVVLPSKQIDYTPVISEIDEHDESEFLSPW